jgi:hypothetical protein
MGASASGATGAGPYRVMAMPEDVSGGGGGGASFFPHAVVVAVAAVTSAALAKTNAARVSGLAAAAAAWLFATVATGARGIPQKGHARSVWRM